MKYFQFGIFIYLKMLRIYFTAEKNCTKVDSTQKNSEVFKIYAVTYKNCSETDKKNTMGEKVVESFHVF